MWWTIHCSLATRGRSLLPIAMLALAARRPAKPVIRAGFALARQSRRDALPERSK
jgi:hypothetical protein